MAPTNHIDCSSNQWASGNLNINYKGHNISISDTLSVIFDGKVTYTSKILSCTDISDVMLVNDWLFYTMTENALITLDTAD